MYKILANLGFASKYIYYLPSCHSTNEVANNLLGGSIKEGMIIITDNQTNGKGQRGNTWESEPFKNLTFSLMLKPTFLPVQKQFFLTQMVSVGIANVIQAYVSKKVKIKWPNDIYINDNKIAGILIQNSVKGHKIDNAIVGIGLNVNQVTFFNQKSISLKNLVHHSLDLNVILNEAVNSIFEQYKLLINGEVKTIEKKYIHLLYQLQKNRNYLSNVPFKGKIIGVDSLGRLLIDTVKGVKCFQNQEVKFL